MLKIYISFISNLSNQTFSINCSLVKKVLRKTASSLVFFLSHNGTGISKLLHKSRRHFSSLSLKDRLSSGESEFISFTIFPSR